MQRHFDQRSTGLAPGGYLERLSKALPRKPWSRGPREHWPENAKLVISISLEFDAGTDPCSAVFPVDHADLVVAKTWEYGRKEGVPRLLEIFQRRHVRVTSHMAGMAAEEAPELARELVERGHEGALRGRACSTGHVVTSEEERRQCESDIQKIQQVTGVRPVGFHAPGLRQTPHTPEILQDLGFLYHVDDLSRDEPFIVSLRGKPFVTVPYTLGLNDVVAYEKCLFSSDQYASELKHEFEMLYAEAESRRRMMSVSLHDRLSGRPRHAKVLEEFIIHAQRRPGVLFMRQDDIARFALASSSTPREAEMKKDREAA